MVCHLLPEVLGKGVTIDLCWKRKITYTFMQFYLVESMTRNKRDTPKINVMDLCYLQMMITLNSPCQIQFCMIWCLLLLQFSGQRKKHQVISYASIFKNSTHYFPKPKKYYGNFLSIELCRHPHWFWYLRFYCLTDFHKWCYCLLENYKYILCKKKKRIGRIHYLHKVDYEY